MSLVRIIPPSEAHESSRSGEEDSAARSNAAPELYAKWMQAAATMHPSHLDTKARMSGRHHTRPFDDCTSCHVEDLMAEVVLL